MAQSSGPCGDAAQGKKNDNHAHTVYCDHSGALANYDTLNDHINLHKTYCHNWDKSNMPKKMTRKQNKRELKQDDIRNEFLKIVLIPTVNRDTYIEKEMILPKEITQRLKNANDNPFYIKSLPISEQKGNESDNDNDNDTDSDGDESDDTNDTDDENEEKMNGIGYKESRKSELLYQIEFSQNVKIEAIDIECLSMNDRPTRITMIDKDYSNQNVNLKKMNHFEEIRKVLNAKATSNISHYTKGNGFIRYEINRNNYYDNNGRLALANKVGSFLNDTKSVLILLENRNNNATHCKIDYLCVRGEVKEIKKQKVHNFMVETAPNPTDHKYTANNQDTNNANIFGGV